MSFLVGIMKSRGCGNAALEVPATTPGEVCVSEIREKSGYQELTKLTIAQ
jgi:hypothetical protein